MTRINPFDLSLNQGIGKIGSINSPEKINQNSEQKELQNANIGDFQKSNEDTMVDASSMIDDTESFDMSSFDGKDKGDAIAPADKTNESEQSKENGNEKDKEEMMAQAEEMINNFFDKKNTAE